MKVLFVDQFGKTTGRDTLALANLINCEDVKMTVFLSDNTEIPKDRQYSVKITKGFSGAYEGNIIHKSKNYLRALIELRNYIVTNHFDLVHLQWFSIPWLEWLFIRMLKKHTKIVVTVHDIIPFDNRPLEIQSLNLIYKNTDRILVHTKNAKEEFQKYYKNKTPVNVITQGFCYKPDYMRLDKKEARNKLDIPTEAIVFLYYGTIRPSKGLDTLLKAIENAQKEDKNIYLLAAGALHKVDSKKYTDLAKKVIKNGSKIDFGFLPFEMEKYYFSAADVLVLPYLEGTQSGVAQLGLMYELPIIASSIKCLDEVALLNKNALRFQAGDVEALKNKVLELGKDEEMRHEFEKYSKIIGENNFSLEKKAAYVKVAYKKTVNKEKR